MKRIIGYCDPISAAPGDDVRFMVSCDGAADYRAEILRVISGDDTPGGPGYKVEPVDSPANGDYPARHQAFPAGSYAVVPHGPAFAGLRSLSVQAYIQPTTPAKGRQAIIAKWSTASQTGFALVVDDDGALGFELGDGAGKVERFTTGVAMRIRHWYFAAASLDADSGEVRLFQEPLRRLPKIADEGRYAGQSRLSGPGASDAALTMAGVELDDGRTGLHFNGRIDSPRLAGRALRRDEMASLAHPAPPDGLLDGLIGAWDFSRDIAGDRIADVSANRLHGVTVNQPSRAVKGHNWTGAVHDWTQAPGQYGAIHFHDDDMIDARWQSDFSFTVPDGLKSGFYAARLVASDDESFVPFFVRPKPGAATAPIAVLASTSTYLAYGNYQFHLTNPLAEKQAEELTELTPKDLYFYQHPEIGPSLYDTHSDGSPCHYSSRLRPLLDVELRGKQWSYNADTHLTDWLEAEDFDYDVVCDEDLHREGLALLAPYRVIVTGAHPEYWTTPMWRAMTTYLDHGGRLMYLGGNGFYWRIAHHPENPAIIEVRRAETGERYWVAEPGEYYHGFSGELGGLWRRVGHPPNALVGIGTVSTGYDRSYPYRRTKASFDSRAAFIFEGVGDDEVIGDFGAIGGGAAGIELDGADEALGTPPHALVVARSFGHSSRIRLALEETVFHHQYIGGDETDRVSADMVFFETGGGGAVFTTGSIAWCASLSHDDYGNNVARVTGNVLRRFANPEPFG